MDKEDLIFDKLKIKDQIPVAEEITIDYLNNDCLIHIFKYLCIKDKLKIERVSKRWNEVAKCSWSTIQTFSLNHDCIKFTEDKIKCTEFLINILDRCGKYLYEVSLYAYEGIDYSLMLKELSKYGENIKNLSISNLMPSFYGSDTIKLFCDQDLELLFSKVNVYNLSFRYFNINGNCLSNLRADCIKEITISNIHIDEIDYLYNFCSNLKNLNKMKIYYDTNAETVINVIDGLAVSKCKDVQDFSVSLSSRAVTSVKSLSNFLLKQKNICNLLLDYISIDQEIINSIPSDNLTTLQLSFDRQKNTYFSLDRLKNLKTFTCYHHSITEDDLKIICTAVYAKEIDINFRYDLLCIFKKVNCFKNLQHLETLTIFHQKDYYIQCVDNVIEGILKCISLKHLKLFECHFTNEGLINVTTIPNLIKLTVYSDYFYNSQLENFVKKAPNLQELDISGCSRLTSNLIKSISDIKSKRLDDHILKVNIKGCHNIILSKLNDISPLISLL